VCGRGLGIWGKWIFYRMDNDKEDGEIGERFVFVRK